MQGSNGLHAEYCSGSVSHSSVERWAECAEEGCAVGPGGGPLPLREPVHRMMFSGSRVMTAAATILYTTSGDSPGYPPGGRATSQRAGETGTSHSGVHPLGLKDPSRGGWMETTCKISRCLPTTTYGMCL
ncbi:hypothetical protein DPEC_G00134630 [Dallia pectoralis]|uniref:Uncharacterized protein n=1 Tax=Dallia pectoralis TaxID=75939 RepID=A0ACC2GSF2_DALPE|nr:hypothetical protein DPEC_G00134630 [Dallia pectoralis]